VELNGIGKPGPLPGFNFHDYWFLWFNFTWLKLLKTENSVYLLNEAANFVDGCAKTCRWLVFCPQFGWDIST